MTDWRTPFLSHIKSRAGGVEGREEALKFLLWHAEQGHSAFLESSQESMLSLYAEEGASVQEREAAGSQLSLIWESDPWISEPYLYREKTALGPALVWGMDRRKEEEAAAWLADRLQWDPPAVAQPHPGLDEEQNRALHVLRSAPLGIISGGPGTGKTHLVTVYLEGLSPALRSQVAVAAPTGRAASRINEQLEGLGTAVTLHSLLGLYGAYGSEPKWRRGRYLPYQAVIVDEASMVDTELMLHLLRALPAQARLILVGDSLQLPSIAGGAVFRDAGEAARILGSPACVELKVNHRLEKGGSEKALGLFFDRLRDGKVSGALPDMEGVAWKDNADWEDLVEQTAIDWQKKAGRLPENSEQLREWLGEEILLLPMRKGPHGIDAFQASVQEKIGNGRLYQGMPVIVRANQKALGLMNGDRGMVRRQQGYDAVVFPGERKEVKTVPLSSIERLEAGYALTIHQCQGSEFRKVRLALPPGAPAMLSLELFYTAVTRTREELHLYASHAALKECLRVRTVRTTLLKERILRQASGK